MERFDDPIVSDEDEDDEDRGKIGGTSGWLLFDLCNIFSQNLGCIDEFL